MALRIREGKWAWRYELDGREYSGTTDLAATKRQRKDAEAEELQHRMAIKEGRQPIRKLAARLFSDASADFLTHCKTEHRAHPETARRIATSFVSLRVFFGKAMVGAIGAAEIDKYKAWRVTERTESVDGKERTIPGVADVTLRHDLHALSGFYHWAVKMRFAGSNPVSEVKIPSDEDAVRIHVITADEERRYFAAALADKEKIKKVGGVRTEICGRQTLYDIGRILLLQGLRPAEAMALTAGDVDLMAGTLRVSKSKTKAGRRTLTLTAESRSILGRRCAGLAPEARVWQISAPGLAKKHGSACRRAGVDFVPYDFRHTFATRLAQGGCDLATIAALIGHSSIHIVQRYVHPTAEHQAQAMRTHDAAQIAAQPKEAVQ